MGRWGEREKGRLEERRGDGEMGIEMGRWGDGEKG